MDNENCPRPFRISAKAPGLVRALGVLELVAVIFTAAAYAYLLYSAFTLGGIRALAMYITVSAAPFILVSLMRRIINRKRPEEKYDFPSMGIPVSGKRGASFPSRHTFSAFLIAALALPTSLPLGIILMITALYIAVYRVISAKHYISDAVVGAALGIFMGLFGSFSASLVF